MMGGETNVTRSSLYVEPEFVCDMKGERELLVVRKEASRRSRTLQDDGA